MGTGAFIRGCKVSPLWPWLLSLEVLKNCWHLLGSGGGWRGPSGKEEEASIVQSEPGGQGS